MDNEETKNFRLHNKHKVQTSKKEGHNSIIKYVTCKDINSRFSVSSSTLRTWAKSGKIRSIQNEGTNRYRYCIEDVKKCLGYEETLKETKPTLLYARVSSRKQIEDLERQIELLKGSYPDNKVLKDIGSGLNYNRSSFRTLVKEILQGEVGTVVVTYRDRLLRFGFDFFEQMCELNGTKIITLFQEDQSPDEEIRDDLIAVCTYFTAKTHGKRSNKYKNKNTEIEINSLSETSI